jgi:hypothetical protein
MASKQCSKCKVEKPLEAFQKNWKGGQGRKAICKECVRLARHAALKPKSSRPRRTVEHLQSLAELRASCSEGMKVCSNCLSAKPLEGFHSHAGFPAGKQSWCTTCIATDHRVHGRKRRFKWLYGLTEVEYDSMLTKQGGCCAVCGTQDPGGRFGHFVVDHNHETGQVRGLLCNACNMGIGQMADCAERLESAAIYLRSFPAADEQNPGG